MTIRPGALRFNTDSMKLEIFRGSANYEGSASMAGIGTLAAGQWEEIQATSPEFRLVELVHYLRGECMPSVSDIIDYINLDTTGDAIDFGNLLSALRNMYLVLHQGQEEYLVVEILIRHISMIYNL